MQLSHILGTKTCHYNNNLRNAQTIENMDLFQNLGAKL